MSEDHAEWLGWMEAQGYHESMTFNWADTADAFAAGMQAARDLAARPAPEAELTGAEAKVAEARKVLGNFLGQYGDSKIPMFKVGQDLANSLLKILGSPGEA